LTITEQLVEPMRAFTRRQLAVFCVSCAARISPAFAPLAQQTPTNTYDNWTGRAWQAVDALDQEMARALDSQIMSTPEANETDSYQAAYWAMRALAPLAYAVEAVFENGLERAEWSSRATADLLADLSYDVPNNLRELEFGEQAAVIAWLAAAGEGFKIEEAIDRAEKSQVKALIADVVRRFAVSNGWKSSAP